MCEEITVKEILAEWLESHGYDGLYNDFECGCEIGDLIPCGESCERCVAAYKISCADCRNSGCEVKDSSEEHQWVMYPTKDFVCENRL